MKREIKRMDVNGAKDAIKVEVVGNPNSVGLCARYEISPVGQVRSCSGSAFKIEFHEGPPFGFEINGITDEALLAVLEHRFAGRQSGPYANALLGHALEGIRQALACLQPVPREPIAPASEDLVAV